MSRDGAPSSRPPAPALESCLHTQKNPLDPINQASLHPAFLYCGTVVAYDPNTARTLTDRCVDSKFADVIRKEFSLPAHSGDRSRQWFVRIS
jgi:hypothetical protein